MFKKKKKKSWISLPLIVIICIWYNHSQYVSAEKGDYKILYCHFFGWQTEQKICWIHSPACLLDKQVLNEVENVNECIIVQVNSEETLDVEPTCLI